MEGGRRRSEREVGAVEPPPSSFSLPPSAPTETSPLPTLLLQHTERERERERAHYRGHSWSEVAMLTLFVGGLVREAARSSQPLSPSPVSLMSLRLLPVQLALLQLPGGGGRGGRWVREWFVLCSALSRKHQLTMDCRERERVCSE